MQNQNRVKDIQRWLPQAMQKREESECTGTQHFADLFRRAMAQGVVIVDQ